MAKWRGAWAGNEHTSPVTGDQQCIVIGHPPRPSMAVTTPLRRGHLEAREEQWYYTSNYTVSCTTTCIPHENDKIPDKSGQSEADPYALRFSVSSTSPTFPTANMQLASAPGAQRVGLTREKKRAPGIYCMRMREYTVLFTV